jgi:hypothetical protein
MEKNSAPVFDDRAADYAKHFPQITERDLEARANFNLREHLEKLRNQPKNAVDVFDGVGTFRKYPCGCTASTPEVDAELPAECPTHSKSTMKEDETNA